MVSSVLSGLVKVLSSIVSKRHNTDTSDILVTEKVNFEQLQFVRYFILDILDVSGLEVIQRQQCDT